MAAPCRSETGAELFARLGPKQDLSQLETHLFPSGPGRKDVVEFIGEEGTGKTQVLMFLLARSILPQTWENVELGGLEAGVIFVDLDLKFSVLRLAGILEGMVTSAFSKGKISISDEDMESLVKTALKRLHYVKCTSSDQLIISLHALDSFIGGNANINILMIDSISSFYWTDRLSGGDSIVAREQNQKKMVQALHHLLSTYNLVLFVSKPIFFYKRNWESDLSTSEESPLSSNISRSTESNEPSDHMCKSWQKFVSQQFLFTKQERLKRGGDGCKPVIVNSYQISWQSKEKEKKSKQFTICDQGIVFS